MTKSAWYKLKRPEKKQEPLHLRLRAVCGLVLNLCAMLGEFTESTSLDLVNYLESVHKDLSPNESHMVLSPGLELLERHPYLPIVPFDLDLLHREVVLVRKLLQDFDETLTIQKSKFMKGLLEMQKIYIQAKKRGERWTTEKFDYLSSAIASEQRGGFSPWGDRIPNAPRECLSDFVQSHLLARNTMI